MIKEEKRLIGSWRVWAAAQREGERRDGAGRAGQQVKRPSAAACTVLVCTKCLWLELLTCPRTATIATAATGAGAAGAAGRRSRPNLSCRRKLLAPVRIVFASLSSCLCAYCVYSQPQLHPTLPRASGRSKPSWPCHGRRAVVTGNPAGLRQTASPMPTTSGTGSVRHPPGPGSLLRVLPFCPCTVMYMYTVCFPHTRISVGIMAPSAAADPVTWATCAAASMAGRSKRPPSAVSQLTKLPCRIAVLG